MTNFIKSPLLISPSPYRCVARKGKGDSYIYIENRSGLMIAELNLLAFDTHSLSPETQWEVAHTTGIVLASAPILLEAVLESFQHLYEAHDIESATVRLQNVIRHISPVLERKTNE